MTLTIQNDLSIVEIAFYAVFLAVALYLITPISFCRFRNWHYVIVLCLLRIVGSCLQLATINDPTNINLYIGSVICQGIGVSPLFLSAMRILQRANNDVSKDHGQFFGLPFVRFYRVIQLIVIVGLILGIVGGTNAGDHLASTGQYVPQTLSKVGVGLFLAAFIGICAGTAVTILELNRSRGRWRPIFVGLVVSLPFLVVRLAYSCVSTWANDSDFNIATGNAWIFFGMSILMEIIVIALYEATGLKERFDGTEEAEYEKDRGANQRINNNNAPPPPQAQYYGNSQMEQPYYNNNNNRY